MAAGRDCLTGLTTIAVFPAVLFCLISCGDDNPVKPPREAGTIVVTSAAELGDALEHSVAGDTIELRAEFSSPMFTMTKGYSIPSSRSPVTIQGTPKSGFLRSEIVFPANVAGITLTGHSGSVIRNLDFRGGSDVISLVNSSVEIQGLVIRNNAAGFDCVKVTGAGSSGTISGCLLDHPGRYGVSTGSGSTVLITRNTVVHAGNSGFYVGSNARLVANNIYDAQNFGIFCDDGAASPTLSCNNAFMSGNGNYVCPAVLDVLKSNYALNPQFCPDSDYHLDFSSPLLEVNSGGCGRIGAFGVGPACQP